MDIRIEIQATDTLKIEVDVLVLKIDCSRSPGSPIRCEGPEVYNIFGNQRIGGKAQQELLGPR